MHITAHRALLMETQMMPDCCTNLRGVKDTIAKLASSTMHRCNVKVLASSQMCAAVDLLAY